MVWKKTEKLNRMSPSKSAGGFKSCSMLVPYWWHTNITDNEPVLEGVVEKKTTVSGMMFSWEGKGTV